MGGCCFKSRAEYDDETAPLVKKSSIIKNRNSLRNPKVEEVSEEEETKDLLTQQKICINDFTLIALIGEDTNKIYAMKVLVKQKLKDSGQFEHTITERSVLQYVEHPFLVTLRFAFQTTDKLYMVMDFVNGGELFFHLRKSKRFSEDRAKFYAAEIFLAIEHLHSLNIIYRDLKPENILMDSHGHIRLTDFGLAKIMEDESRTHTFCGTPEYLAPEVILQKGHGKAVDWWSFGTLLFEMLVGLPPFYNRDVQEMYQKILNSDLKFPEQIGISEEGKDLLKQLLERDSKKRLGSGEDGPEEIKNHPFFESIDFNQLLKKQLIPPFAPDLKDSMDLSFFDEEFTKKSIKEQSERHSNKLQEKDQKVFQGFTFGEDSAFSVGVDVEEE
eukprot:gene8959-908_t